MVQIIQLLQHLVQICVISLGSLTSHTVDACLVQAPYFYSLQDQLRVGSSDEGNKNFIIPSYANVELDDGSVPMTTNPNYG